MIVQDLRANDDPSLSVIPRISTFEELTTWVKVSVDETYGWAAAPPNALVWQCIGFYIRSGAATFIPKFQQENGSPAKDILVVHSWPGAPNLHADLEVTPDYSNRTGVAGFTNASGDAGFPYSGGMVYSGSKPFNGPGIVWPLCPTHLTEPKYADCAKGLGWFGGTDHTTVNPIFKLVRKGNNPSVGFSVGLFQNGIDLGVRIAFVNQPGTNGWELVLFDDKGQILGSSKFE